MDLENNSFACAKRFLYRIQSKCQLESCVTNFAFFWTSACKIKIPWQNRTTSNLVATFILWNGVLNFLANISRCNRRKKFPLMTVTVSLLLKKTNFPSSATRSSFFAYMDSATDNRKTLLDLLSSTLQYHKITGTYEARNTRTFFCLSDL